MELDVKVVKRGNRYYVLPGENALIACKLTNHEFLTTEDLKTLELMGFKIVIEEETSKS